LTLVDGSSLDQVGEVGGTLSSMDGVHHDAQLHPQPPDLLLKKKVLLAAE